MIHFKKENSCLHCNGPEIKVGPARLPHSYFPHFLRGKFSCTVICFPFHFYTLRWFGDSETRQYEGSLFSQHHGQHPAPLSFYPLARTPKVPDWRDSSLQPLPHHRIFPSQTSGSEPKTTVSLKTVVCGRRVLSAPCLVLIRAP